jgi:hypothetical protein
MYYDDGVDKDGAAENPYDKIDCQNWECIDSQPTEILWQIRLPKYIKEWSFNLENDLDNNYELLDEQHSLIQHSSLPKNDAIVDRQIRWNYNSGWTYPFSIFASQRYSESEGVYKHYDSAIRESHINNDLNFHFWGNNKQWSPIPPSTDNRGKHSELIIISPKENDIKEYSLWCNLVSDPWCLHNDFFFNKILTSEEYTNKQLRFSLLNLLQAKLPWMIYPFLEYYVDFWTKVSDKYFTINAEWNYDDYKINTIIRKPTIKESILWNFTTIF